MEGKIFTSHVLFAFKDNKCVSPMGLLLLVGLLMRMSVLDNPNLRWVSSIHRTVQLELIHVR